MMFLKIECIQDFFFLIYSLPFAILAVLGIILIIKNRAAWSMIKWLILLVLIVVAFVAMLF